jgi:hypothetical protein
MQKGVELMRCAREEKEESAEFILYDEGAVALSLNKSVVQDE